MLNITRLLVRSFSIDYLDIFWDVAPCYDDVLDYECFVQRSISQYGPYVDVGAAQIGQFWFRDTTIRGQHSFYDRLWYRLRVRRRSTAEEFVFPAEGGTRLGAEPDLTALEMARMENLILREAKGRKVWVFPVRTGGQRCTTCWDHVQQKRLLGNCGACFGTGWAGGYFAPIECYMQIVTPDQAVMRTPQSAQTEVENTTFALGNYPELGDKFLVIEAENVRWKVGSRVQKVMFGRALVRQQGTLFRIPLSDIEYRIPLRLTTEEVRNLSASPDRNYTAPQNVESSDLDTALRYIYDPSRG